MVERAGEHARDGVELRRCNLETSHSRDRDWSSPAARACTAGPPATEATHSVRMNLRPGRRSSWRVPFTKLRIGRTRAGNGFDDLVAQRRRRGENPPSRSCFFRLLALLGAPPAQRLPVQRSRLTIARHNNRSRRVVFLWAGVWPGASFYLLMVLRGCSVTHCRPHPVSRADLYWMLPGARRFPENCMRNLVPPPGLGKGPWAH